MSKHWRQRQWHLDHTYKIWCKLPCTVPHGYCRAFTILLPTLTSSMLPTTANGIWPYNALHNLAILASITFYWRVLLIKIQYKVSFLFHFVSLFFTLGWVPWKSFKEEPIGIDDARFFTGRMAFLSTNQQHQSAEGIIIQYKRTTAFWQKHCYQAEILNFVLSSYSVTLRAS